MKSLSLLYLGIAFTLNAIANVLLKAGALNASKEQTASPFLSLLKSPAALVGIGLFAMNLFFYFLALKTVPLSTAYPIMMIMSFLIINGFAFFYFHESIHSLQIAGYGLIVVGLVLVFKFSSVA